MGDIKLFHVDNHSVTEIEGQSATVEKSIQTLIERHLEALLGIRFLASEHSTGKKHRGRIDTLGIDENGYPVIIEYKRSLNENVINQGLFYLDWLLDHKGAFTLLVMQQLGQDAADGIEWSNPRLLCIAGDFTRYDQYAVEQINRNIELIRYRRYGDELLLFELVNVSSKQEDDGDVTPPPNGGGGSTVTQLLAKSSRELQDRYETLKSFLLSLGDDVQMKTLKNYFAFRRIRNFACVEVHPQSRELLVYVKVDPESVELEEGFTRDVRSIGHYGTGDLEIRIKSDEDLERARPLLLKSYEAS